MKRKKPLLTIYILFLVGLIGIASVFAHPGSLDANGGHWDRKNGTYHFHEGKNTSGNSTPNPDYKYPYADFKPPYEPPTDNPYKKDTSSNKNNSSSTDFWDIIGYMFIFFFVGTVIINLGEFIYDVFLADHLPKHKISRLIDKISEYNQLQKEILAIHSDLLDLNLTIKIPDSYEIDTANLPRDKDRNSKWGKSFTMYKTAKGKKLHPKYNCCFATDPVHICWYRNRCNFSDLLCSKCAYSYTLPDLSWYDEYMNCQKLKKTQSNKESRCQELCKEIEKLHKKCNSISTTFLIVFSKKNRITLRKANALYNEMKTDYKNEG